MIIPKTLDNFKIELKDGTTYDMADDLHLLVRSFIIGSPQPIIYKENIEGRSGGIRMGKDFGERPLKAICSFFGVDKHDFALLRNKLFQILMKNDTFYLISDAEPGKRWLVEVDNGWDYERVGHYGEFTLEFISEQAYAESIGTTLDPLTFDADLWQFGQGLTVDEKDYKPTTKTFQIFNAGDVAVDPREHPMNIKFRFTEDNSDTYVEITNNTTGDYWRYDGDVYDGSTINIDGVKTVRSTGTPLSSKTNYGLITLVPGWNDFTVVGDYYKQAEFDFRFYFL